MCAQYCPRTGLRPGKGNDFVGLDFKHNTGNPPEVRKGVFTLRKDKLEISEQVSSKEKKLNFGDRLPQAEPCTTSERQ